MEKTSDRGRSGAPPRPITIDGDVGYIPLTQGYTAMIDASDVPLVESWRWTSNIGARVVYAYRNQYHPSTRKQTRLSLHRFLVDAPAGMLVDHINGNGLDNRRSNLRVTTARENQRNRFYHRDPSKRPTTSDSATGVRGVYRTGDSFVARAHVNGRQIDLARGDDLAALGRLRHWYFSLLHAPPAANDSAFVEFARTALTQDGLTASARVAALRAALRLDPE